MASLGLFYGSDGLKKSSICVKKNALYAILVVYLLLYTLMILLSGVWLFLLSQGLASSHSLLLTLQDIIQMPETKSIKGLIEVATPHLFAMGGLIFVSAHLMLFSTKVSKKVALFVSVALFGFALLDIFSYFMITLGWVVLGWIKLLALLGFLLVFSLLLGLLSISL